MDLEITKFGGFFWLLFLFLFFSLEPKAKAVSWDTELEGYIRISSNSLLSLAAMSEISSKNMPSIW